MNINSVITLIGILVAAVVALVIGYMHRRQMRQIEVFRQNASVGLLPPPHPIARYLKHNRRFLLMYASSLYLLGSGLLKSGPLTRWSVLMISFGIAGLLFGGIMQLLDRMLSTIEGLINVNKEVIRVQGKIIGVLSENTAVPDKNNAGKAP